MRGAGVNLVEDAAVAEIVGLSFAPAAEIVDGHEVDLAEAGDIIGVGQFRLEGAIVVGGGDGLAVGGVEIFEIGLGRLCDRAQRVR